MDAKPASPDLPSEARADVMRHPLHLISSPRGATARLAVAAALALPATALAAPAPDDSATPPPVIGGEATASIGAVMAGNGVGLGASELAPAGPFNPVTAKVDYGTAINTFGGGGMRTHEGHDMFAPEGTPLISPTATEVLEAGTDGGRGNWAALYDPKAKRTYVYMHMLEPAGVEGRPEARARRARRPAGLHRLLRRRPPPLRDPRGQGPLRRSRSIRCRSSRSGSPSRADPPYDERRGTGQLRASRHDRGPDDRAARAPQRRRRGHRRSSCSMECSASRPTTTPG